MSDEILVEIGAMSRPVFSWSETALAKINQGAIYLNIDRVPNFLGHIGKSGLGEEVVGSLDCLPIASKSTHEVWLANVFTHGINRHEDTDSQFGELFRILKPNGRIFIVETITPGIWLLKENFSRFGLEVEAELKGCGMVDFIVQQGINQKFSRELLTDFLSCGEVSFQPFVLVLKKHEPGNKS